MEQVETSPYLVPKNFCLMSLHLKSCQFVCWLQIKQQETLLEMQLTPFSILLRALLDQLQAKDQARIFTQPVDVNEVNISPVFRVFLFISLCVIFHFRCLAFTLILTSL